MKRFIIPLETPSVSALSRKYSRCGFTLVELLVTIAIISALVALVFIGVQHAREKGHNASCTNNLRQIGVAMLSYEGDNNRLPGRETGMAWDRAILPYLGYDGDEDLAGNERLDRADWADGESALAIFSCPSDQYKRSSNFYKRSYAIVPWTTNWSNGTAFRGWKNRPLNRGIPLSVVDSPARAAMVVEWHQGIEGTENCCGSGAHAFHDRGGPDGDGRDVHKQKQNVLFADGHIESLRFMPNSEFVENYWPGTIGDLD